MPSTCEIEFDNPNGVYYSGDILSGSVTLETTSEKTVRAIFITIKGTGKVAWDNQRSHDNYLSSTAFALGTEGGLTFSLPPGSHEYTFSAFLPHQLPTSFSGKYGFVKYEVIVTIHRPLKIDMICKEVFTVIQNLDLNLNPIHLQPKEVEIDKNIRCCCCASGTMNSKLSIPFGGYAPGQKLKYTLLIENGTNNDVTSCKIKFIQRVIYVSRINLKNSRNKDNLIASKTLEGATRFSKKTFDKEIRIPSLPPSTYSDKAIIKIEYLLTAKIETIDTHAKQVLSIPLVIGTVPLYASTSNPNVEPTAAPLAPPNIDQPPESPASPPLTEQE